MDKEHFNQGWVEANIKDCQLHKHIQQVAYSTYHNALTQICFTCNKVRTSLRPEELCNRPQMSGGISYATLGSSRLARVRFPLEDSRKESEVKNEKK